MRLLPSIIILSGWCLFSITAQAESLYPTAECFKKAVWEGNSMNCECKANRTDSPTGGSTPALTFSWPGRSSNASLRVDNVRREDNGTQYTCLMQMPGAANKTVTYTLQVAYGPFKNNVHIDGPDKFVTDGNRTVSLNCSASNANPAPAFSWSFVNCKDPLSSTCEFTPTPPVQDHQIKTVCTATNPEVPPLVQASALFFLKLEYPPVTAPHISTTSRSEILKSGSTVTCTVTGGNPPVKDIIFTCTNPTLHGPTVVRKTSVSSSYIIDTSEATANSMMCNCSALWEPEPELYQKTAVAYFFLEYKPTINNFTINMATELNVYEGDQQSANFRCDVTGRPEANVTLLKQGNDTRLGQTEDMAENKTVKVRRKIHSHTMTSVRCEDTGTFTCSANSGFLDVSKKSVRLIVSCGPRFFNGSFDPPPKLRSEGLTVFLVAHPVPRDFQYSYINDTVTQTKRTMKPFDEGEGLFHAECQRNDYMQYLVACTFRQKNIPEEMFGVYNVSVSNTRGTFVFSVEVEKDEPRPLMSASTTVLMVVIIAAIAAILLLAVIVFCVRKKKNRGRYRREEEATDQGGGF